MNRIPRFTSARVKSFKHKPVIFGQRLFPLWKIKKSRYKFVAIQKQVYMHSPIQNKMLNSKPILKNQPSYLYNKNLFQYQIRDLINKPSNNVLMHYNFDVTIHKLKKQIYSNILHKVQWHKWMSELTRKETFGALKEYNYSRKLLYKWKSAYMGFFKSLFKQREHLKMIIIALLTLKGAKKRKYLSRVRYLTEIPLYLNDFRLTVLYAYLCENRYNIKKKA